ncbi:OLC1v1014033C1 [Oldenlandia corymbosa var. corymbosa]|uniref:cysteine dioxygenase n=1 Tax=Oldenlandia corymbosa var. corymbosa TaxID=529605 RepID=A0AAV1DZU2_OLDCO|nr:OLC1v1014033C1 [Oldenlandia corymbosa var. corymbosa]
MCRYRSFFTAMTKKSSSSSSIQALFDLCKRTFTPSGTPPLPPSPQATRSLCAVLDKIAPADIGLGDQNQEDDRGHGLLGLNVFSRVNRWAQPITYVDIYEGNDFTMCIFCFPTSSVIPLHDHPGMTVFSKLLYGSLHVKAYDWVEPAQIRKSKQIGHPTVRLAKLVVDKVLTAPCGTSVLYPKTGGNLHCFTAITPCAVLDVLAPPYLEEAGRRCTYYHDYPYSTFSADERGEAANEKDEEYAWLAEISTPDDLHMRSGRYTGPAIQTW